jgi:hypothetical protein
MWLTWQRFLLFDEDRAAPLANQLASALQAYIRPG